MTPSGIEGRDRFRASVADDCRWAELSHWSVYGVRGLSRIDDDACRGWDRGEQPFARGCRRVDPTATAQSSTLPCIGRRAQVVVLALGANDGLRRGDIRSMTAPLDAIIRQAQGAGAEVVLAGMEAPAAHGAAYTSALRNAFRQLAAAHRLALMPFLLDGVALDPALNQADGSHPNETGAEMIASRLWPYVDAALRQPAARAGRQWAPHTHRECRTDRVLGPNGGARAGAGGPVESYPGAIIGTDGLAAGWRADYADRDAAVDDVRRHATRGASEPRKRNSRCRRTARRSANSASTPPPRASLWPRRLQQ